MVFEAEGERFGDISSRYKVKLSKEMRSVVEVVKFKMINLDAGLNEAGNDERGTVLLLTVTVSSCDALKSK